MKKTPINDRLLLEFPQLRKCLDSQDAFLDMDTPALNFYECTLLPYLKDCIQKEDKEEIRHCFIFIEEMINDEDENVQNIAETSLLVNLYEAGFDLSRLPLGKSSQEYYLTWLKGSK